MEGEEYSEVMEYSLFQELFLFIYEENDMVMKYILIRKNVKQNEMYFSSIFKAELGEMFSNLSNNTFELELTGKIYVLDYKFSNKQNRVYHLHIEFYVSPAIEADVLNEVSKKLNSSEIRKNII